MRALVACFICAFAAGFSFRSNHWESLVLIDSTDYGRRILDTIHVELMSKGSVDKIVGILNELRGDLVEQQRLDDIKIQEKREECTRVIGGYTDTINRLTPEITQLEIDIPILETKFDEVTNKYNKKLEEIKELEGELKSYDSDFEKDTKDYEARVADHKEAVTAVEATLEYLKKLKGSQAGEGKHETSEAIEGETRAYDYSAQSLIQLGADQETLDKLVNKLTDVKKNLELSIDDEDKRHDQAEEDYNTTRGKIVATINDLKSARDSLKNDKDRLEGELGVAKETLTNKKTEKKNAETAKTLKETECKNAEDLYQNNKKKRAEEVSTVDAILDILKNKSLQEVDKYLDDTRVQEKK
jgi:chromosome segregation ATPase